jgi:hypothetical protein
MMPASGCGPGCVPRLAHRVATPVRVARVAGVVATVAAGVPVALALPVLTARARKRAVRGWFRPGATRGELAAATATALADLDERGRQPADQGSTQRHAPGRITQVRRRTGPEMSPSALT